MIAAGLVAQSDTQDPRRIYYKLTSPLNSTGEAGILARVSTPSRGSILIAEYTGDYATAMNLSFLG